MNEPLKLRSCVGALIFNEDGQVLLGKRSSVKKTSVGRWQLPQGGVEVEKNEDYYAAVVREIKEEVGLSINSNCLRYVSKVNHPITYTYAPDDPENTKRKFSGQTIHWYLFYMPADKIASVDLTYEAEPEFQEVKWYDFKKFVTDADMGVPFKSEMYKQLFLETFPIIDHYLIDVKATIIQSGGKIGNTSTVDNNNNNNHKIDT
ncbi:NUDIX hydrolase family protein [Cavenderia fasciculata]|uniref:NUDIX hydrolase family protein n=1 Tax=Cavenderia fasciculata TaxID=261658 RepID=F4QEB2_CACFS|nr:NUDIX hydrolase family protein [Cavenderia fasciculata]EGG14059.1 NUDIX hydrolase family protein [Cavenderia fasciculata]|eukprot:XP_004350767.1 NUDIX hydrolase family protein [Cavenderia fasciculata]